MRNIHKYSISNFLSDVSFVAAAACQTIRLHTYIPMETKEVKFRIFIANAYNITTL